MSSSAVPSFSSSSMSSGGGGGGTVVRHVTIIHPTKPNPVNSLGSATRTHIRDQLLSAISDPSVSSMVLIGNGSNFSAGADIAEFSIPASAVESTDDVPSLVVLCELIESSPKPIVAALRGVALGGGCELACHYRIVDSPNPSAAGGASTIGLPECKIGLIPGAGGTQRLSRLCGAPFALGVIASGRTIRPAEA
eukprot:CAMPEP_0113598010 /NCGR_PEP_ID=MMETSP0015_2-20120614/41330_1 /TAXON_ID=2838 /ORGANISM="Odontella" /LENGTH=193 /DNA_ID=CAMNT_0000505941 /DNA_START=28 /DNA_END=606 /DNA_ORIENTATION=- /assembly_acc=CAM_ASM_000160